MAIIDVVTWEANAGQFCFKFPSTDLRFGTQLVVHPAQTAFFVRDGQILDSFEPGRYTLESKNLPLLNKLVNLPFGGNTPFMAEVWFVNKTAKLDMKWGTPEPIQLEDPKYNIIVPVRSFGQYGLRVKDPKQFLLNFVGNSTAFNADKIDSYYKGKILSMLSALISQKISRDSISILDINSGLVEMSEFCNEQINQKLEKYGVEILEFTFSSISVPQNDPSIVKLKEAKDMAMRLKVAGKDVYQMERSFDVMERAASNEGNAFASMGAGLGAGFGVGGAMGNMFAQNLNTAPPSTQPPPLPQAVQYYISINGNQMNTTVQNIFSMIQNKQVTGDTLAWKAGMQNWSPLSQMPEFTQAFQQPPPMPPQVPPMQPPPIGT